MNNQIIKDDSLIDSSSPSVNKENTCSAPSQRAVFTDFTRRLFAVPKEEYDKEAEAVANGKPLKQDFSKRSHSTDKK